MYNGSQIVALVKMLVCALLIFVLLNVCMWVSTTLAPSFFWVPKQFFGVDFVKENYQKVQGAKAYYRDPINKKNTSLVVLLGLSSASEGISIQQLQKQASGRSDNVTRFLSLSGAGRNFKEIAIYAEPLVNSTLDPKLVILAINPFHLMDPPVRKLDLWQVLIGIPRLQLLGGWFATKRDDLRHLVDMKVLNIRTSLFDWFGNRVDEKGLDPWRENTLMGLRPLQTTEQWQHRINEYGYRGYYNINSYQHGQQQTIILSKLLKTFSKKGSKVVVVLMPEHTSLYQNVPENVMQTLVGELKEQLSGGKLPRIVDLRQAIPDSGFNDISHMNQDGRESFTDLLDKVVHKECSKP